jgi:ubiquinone/menaquinone biosynthesis C-methylase UbiE
VSIERDVAGHYAQGGIECAIIEALRGMGKNPDHLAPADLAPVDEFHMGGLPATVELAGRLGLRRDTRLLDVGSGLGGPARQFAELYGCSVTGIDLTEEFVAVANSLSRRSGMDRLVHCVQGSALDLPFDAAFFDGAYMMHVGMNIADKARLFAQVRRVLKSGGFFAIYDVMQISSGQFAYPVPWATAAATSFVEGPRTYRALLEAESFTITSERGRGAFALEYTRAMQAAATAAGGLPPLGPHIIFGPAFRERVANLTAAVEAGVLEPREIISRLA